MQPEFHSLASNGAPQQEMRSKMDIVVQDECAAKDEVCGTGRHSSSVAVATKQSTATSQEKLDTNTNSKRRLGDPGHGFDRRTTGSSAAPYVTVQVGKEHGIQKPECGTQTVESAAASLPAQEKHAHRSQKHECGTQTTGGCSQSQHQQQTCGSADVKTPHDMKRIAADRPTVSAHAECHRAASIEEKAQHASSGRENQADTRHAMHRRLSHETKQPTKVVIVGNPGVGKSMIQNTLVGKPVFKSGISLGGGLTKRLSSCNIGQLTFIDTPGLDDIYHRKTAAGQISAALRGPCAVKLVFVTTLESGRVRPADVCTLQTIVKGMRDVVGDMSNKYALIINKCEPSVAEQLRKGDWLELRARVFGPFLAVEEVKQVEVIEFDGALRGKSAVLLKSEAREKVRRMIDRTATVHLPAEPLVKLEVGRFEEESAQIGEDIRRHDEGFDGDASGGPHRTPGWGSRVQEYPQAAVVVDAGTFSERLRQFSNRALQARRRLFSELLAPHH